MKILRANKTHAEIRVTKRELEAIMTALMEWGLIENGTYHPAREIWDTYEFMHRAIAKWRTKAMQKHLDALRDIHKLDLKK